MLRIPKEGLVKIKEKELEEIKAQEAASIDTLKLSLNDYKVVRGSLK